MNQVETTMIFTWNRLKRFSTFIFRKMNDAIRRKSIGKTFCHEKTVSAPSPLIGRPIVVIWWFDFRLDSRTITSSTNVGMKSAKRIVYTWIEKGANARGKTLRETTRWQSEENKQELEARMSYSFGFAEAVHRWHHFQPTEIIESLGVENINISVNSNHKRFIFRLVKNCLQEFKSRYGHISILLWNMLENVLGCKQHWQPL